MCPDVVAAHYVGSPSQVVHVTSGPCLLLLLGKPSPLSSEAFQVSLSG